MKQAFNIIVYLHFCSKTDQSGQDEGWGDTNCDDMESCLSNMDNQFDIDIDVDRETITIYSQLMDRIYNLLTNSKSNIQNMSLL